MRSLSSVGLALSIVFGCLLLALLFELYYLLFLKKKKKKTRPHLKNDYSTPQTKELLFIFCCPNTNPKVIETQQEQCPPHDDLDVDVLSQGLVPRFLFTIMEETIEEMECEDLSVSIRGKSLHELFLNIESDVDDANTSPLYVTPRASPSLFTPPYTPIMESCNARKEEISSDAEFNKLVRSSSPLSSSSSSPLSRFKFLRDAEEKLYKKRVMEIVETEEVKEG
ncbi:unnamed protein product [Cochlearia groenlandica]